MSLTDAVDSSSPVTGSQPISSSAARNPCSVSLKNDSTRTVVSSVTLKNKR